jgi:hypothetical protein
MSTVKITRFGHRHAQKGVITIASELIHDKLFVGVAFCSPKEFQFEKQPHNSIPFVPGEVRPQLPKIGYNKKVGIDLALHRLSEVKSKNDFTFFDKPMKHEFIIAATLRYIYNSTIPRWAENILLDAMAYPHGLKRYSKVLENINIKKIVVNSEETKDQLIKALCYLHDLHEVNTDFIAVNTLLHQYINPDNIEVELDD